MIDLLLLLYVSFYQWSFLFRDFLLVMAFSFPLKVPLTFLPSLVKWWWTTLTFVWGNPCVSFSSEWNSCQVDHSWLLWVFSFQCFEYIVPLSSGLHIFCWKIHGLVAFSLYISSSLPLAAFKILSLIFDILVVICVFGVNLLGFILFRALSASWTYMSAFPRLGKFSAVISSKKFSASFFFFWDPCNGVLVCFTLS